MYIVDIEEMREEREETREERMFQENTYETKQNTTNQHLRNREPGGYVNPS